MNLFKILVTFSFFISLLTQSEAQDIWRINKDHSEIIFEVPYLGISSISGRFNSFQGGATFNNADDLLPVKIWLMIRSKSIFTSNNMRDGHLRSSDFFRAKKYPLITSDSKNITIIYSRVYKSLGA